MITLLSTTSRRGLAVQGGTNDLLAEAKRRGKVPHVIITNNEFEYWCRSASLIHTTIDGKDDVPLHDKVRLYVVTEA